MRTRILFIASCISLVTSAFTFVVRGDVLQDMGNAFELSQQAKGDIEGAVFLGMAAAMLLGGFICDLLGMKRIMFVAFFCHLVGSVATIGAPVVFQTGGPLVFSATAKFYWLFVASFLMGCGNGMVETGINPLVATLFPLQKTHYLNILHAWWPGGLIIGGLSARFVGKGIDLGFLYIPGMERNWQISLLLIVFPCLVYGAMLVPQTFPLTERVASGVSTFDMFKEVFRPAFLVMAFCMLLTAATELGPQKWQESVMTKIAGISGTLILVYTSGLMFVMRFFAGPLAHRISPIGILTVSAVLSAIGLFALSYATGWFTAIAFATIFGIGIAYFWPTMLGVTAERFPKGGALLLCLMGSAGNLSIYQVLPQMGKIYDSYAVGKLEQENPDLAAKVVRGGAIDQNTVGQMDLLKRLTPDENKAIDPRAWLTPQQWKDFEASGQKELTLGNYLAVKPAPAQSLILQVLLDEDHSELRRGKKVTQELEAASLAPLQKDILRNLRGAQDTVGTLLILQEVKAAELTFAQRQRIADTLQTEKQDNAYKKFTAAEFNPGTLTLKERRAVDDAVKKLGADGGFNEAQTQLVKEKDEVDRAEKHGAAMAFRWVAVLPCILIFIFGAIFLIDLMKGGYKQVHLTKEDGRDGAAGAAAGHVPDTAIRGAGDQIRGGH